MSNLLNQNTPPSTNIEQQKGDQDNNDNDHPSGCCCAVRDFSPRGASASTNAITILRCLMLVLLVGTTALIGGGVYIYARFKERELFRNNYDHSVTKIMKAFHTHIQVSLSALETLSQTITSHANSHNQTFPFVTLPNFESHGANIRIISKSHVVHYMPIVYERNREEWEDYAMQHRSHIDCAFQTDQLLRLLQDEYFSMTPIDESNSDDDIAIRSNMDGRLLQPLAETPWNETVLGDGTGYHPKIWSIGAIDPRGDYPSGGAKRGDEEVASIDDNGGEMYLPLWQRSPISGARQHILNMNFAKSHALNGTLALMMYHGKNTSELSQQYHAVLNAATFPVPAIRKQLEANLLISQYRQDIAEYIDDPSTFLTYPILKQSGSEESGRFVGVLAINLYWKLLFSDILSGSDGNGYICVVENSYEQTFAYQLDGSKASYLGLLVGKDGKTDDDDKKAILESNRKYQYMAVEANIHEYMKQHASPQTQAYTTVSLTNAAKAESGDGDRMGRYTLRIYPSWETERIYVTNQPWLYMMVVVISFVLTSCIFLLFSYHVEQRQQRTSQAAIDAAQSAAKSERELNEFLSHEVRNPLSAAISACNFVASSIQEEDEVATKEQSSSSPAIGHMAAQNRKTLLEDVEVIQSSLNFINDFLRSMLDLQRCGVIANCHSTMQRYSQGLLTLDPKPTDIVHDIFEPISAMLNKRDIGYDFIIGNTGDNNSSNSVLVMVDTLRLKQVVLNLVRNSTKFVEHGFVRMRFEVVAHNDPCSKNDSSQISLKKAKREKMRKSIFQRRCGNANSNTASNASDIHQQPIHSDKTVRIYVEDSGPGISDSKQAALFTKYQASLDVLNQGTGVGLCLSRTLMLAMGGDLWFDDSYSSGIDELPGARFVIDLQTPPIDSLKTSERNTDVVSSAQEGVDSNTKLKKLKPSDGAEQIELSTSRTIDDSYSINPFDIEAGGVGLGSSDNGVSTSTEQKKSLPEDPEQLPSNLSVLFVDDDAVLRKLFVRAICKVAPTWTVREAASGEIAIRLCCGKGFGDETNTSQSPYDLIFVDQYMASVDKQMLGTETIQSLRKLGVTSKICGLSANNVADSFIHAGADCFRLKPLPCRKNQLEQELLCILNGTEDDRGDTIIDC